MECLAAGRNHPLRASSKEKILRNFGFHVDQNTDIAFLSLIRDELVVIVELKNSKYYTINFDQAVEIRRIISDVSNEEKFEIIQPSEEEFQGLNLMFQTESGRDFPNQGIYYYCTKKDDDSNWVVLLKTKVLGKAGRISLGSFNDSNSRISKIWHATVTAANESKDGTFNRKKVEDLEPKACGNNRQPSKAAFDIFKKSELIKKIDMRGNSEIYMLGIAKPQVQNLDSIFIESVKTKVASSSN